MPARSPRPAASHLARPLLLFLACLLSAVSFTGCGTTNAPLGNLTAISASSASVRVNQQLQIQSRMTVTAVPLTFFVNGVEGGNAQLGTINAAGIYTAPAQVPAPNTVTITATANGHPEAAPGSVAIAVLNPIPVLNSIAPTNPTEGVTLITVQGSQFVFGAQILWNGSPVATTFVSSTEVAAAISAPTPGTYPLLVSNPNPGSANSATLNVPVLPGKVVIKIDPGNTDVRVTNSLSLGVQVTGTLNTGVTLAVNGVPGGNATVGTAVYNNGSITYTAPAVVPTPNNIVQLTVTSVDDPTVSVNQNISVLNPIPILTAATPNIFNPGTATVVVTGQKFISGAQVLQNGAPVPTTFNSGTQLTATFTLTQPGTFDIQVLNPDPGAATSSDLIGIVNGNPPPPIVNPADASRFLEQATFGATDADIHDVSMNGYQAWLNAQFALPATPDEPFVEQSILINNPPCASGDVKCNAALFTGNNQGEIYFQDAYWQDALAAPDQLRQRVRYALSEIFVTSSNNSAIENFPRGEAGYYDLLGQDAFGNFRTLLNDVTLSPMMGNYLSVLANDKGNANTDPDENYAREVMQLFTIGLYQLNDDGTRKLDGSGNPIPTYSNTDVQGLAKVFTGFSWNVPGNNSDTAWSDCCVYVAPGAGEDILPMTSYPSHHSTGEKDFLGVTIGSSGNADPNGDLKIALDTLFNHPNLPAFFSKQLIQHLVTSNPSPAYVQRVADVFQNDGTGVRGNLKAVMTAILLDPEARDSATDFANPQYGKVREALLRYTEWARAFTAQSRTGSYGIGSDRRPHLGPRPNDPALAHRLQLVCPRLRSARHQHRAGQTGRSRDADDQCEHGGRLSQFHRERHRQRAQKSGSDSSRTTERRSAWPPPRALLDRINLLLMAGEMDARCRARF